MTREQVEQIFASQLGQQLDTIWVTPDGKPFIRYQEAVNHCRSMWALDVDQPKGKRYEIQEWSKMVNEPAFLSDTTAFVFDNL